MAKQERKLPEVLEHEFIITDESVNRHGWRVIVEGIDTFMFEKNPVCVVQHNQAMVSVGRWVSLTKEKGVLKGKLQFDRNDEYAVYLYWKYTDGYMSAVSISLLPLMESDSKEDLLPGQRYETVVKSELLEVSLVTLPAQGNAVKLYYSDGKEYQASLLKNTKTMEKETKTTEKLQEELQEQKKLNADNLIQLHKQRGVVGDGEVAPLKELALSNYNNVKTMLEARPTPPPASEGTQATADPAEVLAENLVKLHFDRGAITEGEKSVYKLSALKDYESTRKVLEQKTGTQEVKTFVQGLGTGAQTQANDREKWTYLDWYKKDARALGVMEKNEPDKYNKLVADFKAECSLMGIEA